jgi:hypothetical protein
VSLSNESVVVTDRRYHYERWNLPFQRPRLEQGDNGASHHIHVADGWIVGFDGGEFGGSLWSFSENGKNSYKISEGHFGEFLRIGGRIFELEGIAHMGTNRGQVMEIMRDAKDLRWQVKTFVKLHDAPYVVVPYDDNSMLVVTHAGLVRVSIHGQIQIIQEDTFWGGLYPESAVLDSHGTLFIGMNQGVAKLSSLQTGAKVEWMVPDEAFLRREMETYDKNK